MLRFLFRTRRSNGHSYKIIYCKMGCTCGCGGGAGKILMIRNLTMQRLTPIERRENNHGINYEDALTWNNMRIQWE